MLLKLTSNNPDLSYKISKNPNSPPKITDIRKGIGIGWFNDGYNIFFHDGPDSVSFPDKGEEFCYLSKGAYSHPFCAYSLFNKFIPDGEEDEFEYQLTVSSIYLNNMSRRIVSLMGVDITDLSNNYSNIIIKCVGYARFLAKVNTVLFFCNLQHGAAVCENAHIYPMFEQLSKVNAPYYVKYKFKTELIKSEKQFDEIKHFLNTEGQVFCPWDTHESRIRFALDNIRDEDVVDIGCGEGQYVKRLSRQNKSYFGVDRDEECVRLALRKTLDLHNSIISTEIPDLTGKVVLLSEVIEHNEYQEAVDLIKSCKNAKKVIITTPNKEFNQYYGVELRHDDHKFELTQNEFFNMINDIGLSGTFSGVGDLVNGIYPTLTFIGEK